MKQLLRRLFNSDRLPLGNQSQNLSKVFEDYCYSPLETGEIRLVRINPGKASRGLVRCTVFHIKLSSAPEYEAVSYTWGDPNDTCRIICGRDGESLEVTRNCGSIVERFFYRKKPTVAWIDAICINQQDINERNEQVAMMAQIYARAGQVLIDLGEASKDSDLAIATLEDFGTPSRGKPQSPSPQQIKAITNFLERPWFKRAWILQEVYMAKYGHVICGTNGLDWLELVSWMVLNSHRLEHLSSEPYAITMARQKYEREYNVSTDLLNLLYCTQHCGSTDPRDKYFALLGIIPDAHAAGCKGDYHKPAEIVFKELAIYLLGTNGTSLLACVQAGSTIPNLPSWVPDWSLPPANMACRNKEPGTDGGPWNNCRAGGCANLAHYEILSTESCSPLLKVRGIFIDTVCSIVAHFSAQNCSFSSIQQTYADLQSRFLNHPRFASPYPSDTNDLILFRTFTRGELHSRHVIAGEMAILCGDDTLPSTLRKEMTQTDKLSRLFRTNIHNQSLCLTKENWIGLLPLEAQVGDAICIIFGCPMPLVLRPQGGNKWKLLGPCYVDALILGIQAAAAGIAAINLYGKNPPERCDDFMII